MTEPGMGFAKIVDGNGDLVFALAYPSLGLGDKARSPQEIEANARLLIAAPDLLEACKEWVEIDGPTVSLEEQRRRWVGVVAKMRAAIAKAEPPADAKERE